MEKNNISLKDQIRKNIHNEKENLGNTEKVSFDKLIYNKLIESEPYKKADTVFIYVSFGNEVDTIKIIEKLLDDNKIVCVPKVISKKDGMKAIKLSSLDELKIGYFNILEPTGTEEIRPSDIDLCIVPGLAFDNQGGRLGYGGGFYDRFLCDISKDTKTLALAYKFQMVDEIPMDPYDIRVQRIITP